MPAKQFIDLEDAIKRWAWKRYDKNARGKKQKQLRERMLTKDEATIGVMIDWSQVDFHDNTKWSPLVDDELIDDNSNKGSPDKTAVNAAKPSSTSAADVNMLFNTEFTNNTGQEQVYTLKIEKTTRSTCSTEIEKGVTKGVELGVSLKMPSEVFEANAGFKREVSLVKTKGETIEEELNWGAESTISVARGKVAKARLVVREKKQSGDFSVETLVSGNAMVRFTNLLDNNSLLFCTSGQIDFIVQDFLNDERKINNVYEFVQVETPNVTIVTSGKCKFRYGVKQEVEVNQHDI